MRCLIHIAAAYVIGRRAMKFKESIPTVYKGLVPAEKKVRHHWSQYAYLMGVTEGIRVKELMKPVSMPYLDIKDLDRLKRYGT